MPSLLCLYLYGIWKITRFPYNTVIYDISDSGLQLSAIFSQSTHSFHFAEMRLPCVPSRALRGLRAQSLLSRNGQRHSLPSGTRNYNAAVIGGGITGLTAASRLSQDPECSKVTLYEKSGRLGGWMLSERIPVDGGDVLFEYGPRTLRTAAPACLPLIDLVSGNADAEWLLTLLLMIFDYGIDT